ncbi:P-loop containing nucleoside triphosphate hydrolase protein [Phlebopus sp. FC_14]|nr:P-loop containing nucleoside triphosphate hydrolase protein [Phlebopus sp. FC_14]
MSGELHIRISVVGDSGVGKTCLIERFVYDIWNDCPHRTIGLEFRRKAAKINERQVAVVLLDISGHDRYQFLPRSLFRSTDGIIFVYDVTKEDSLKNITTKWNALVEDRQPHSPKMLVADKSDMTSERIVTEDAGRQLADRLELSYMETSCKTGKGVGELFSMIIGACIKYHELRSMPDHRPKEAVGHNFRRQGLLEFSHEELGHCSI